MGTWTNAAALLHPGCKHAVASGKPPLLLRIQTAYKSGLRYYKSSAELQRSVWGLQNSSKKSWLINRLIPLDKMTLKKYNVPKLGILLGVNMKVVGLLILHEFCKNHNDCTQQANNWLAEAQEADWETPSDIKARYVNASFLSDNRVIFNIKGNKYRLDVKIYYERQTVIIKRMGTHAEYNGWRF